MATHRSRVCQFVIDVSGLDQGVAFWTAALDGVEEEISETSREIYRRIRLPDSEIRILLQKTGDRKVSKERMHIDLETDNVEAEVERLEALGAVRWDHQQERGFDFWVLHDPTPLPLGVSALPGYYGSHVRYSKHLTEAHLGRGVTSQGISRHAACGN